MSHGQNLSSTSGESEFVAQEFFEISASGLRSKDLPQVKYICIKGLKILPLVLCLGFTMGFLKPGTICWENNFFGRTRSGSSQLTVLFWQCTRVDWYYYWECRRLMTRTWGGGGGGCSVTFYSLCLDEKVFFLLYQLDDCWKLLCYGLLATRGIWRMAVSWGF